MRVASLTPSATEILGRLGLDATNTSIDTCDLLVTDGSLHHLEGRNVCTFAPTSLGDFFESIISLGRAVGRTLAAEELVTELHRDLEGIRASQPRHRLMVHVDDRSAGGQALPSWVPELVHIAGGHLAPEVDGIHESDPDVLVFLTAGAGEGNFSTLLHQHPYAQLRAARARAVATIPRRHLVTPTPALVVAARKMQEILTQFQHMY